MNDDEIRTPKRIYLQIDNGSYLPTTWSDDSIYDTDIEYIRSDIHNTQVTELQEKLKVAEEAIEWIKGACDIKNDRCLCGRPTGVMAIFHHAKKALSTIKGETE